MPDDSTPPKTPVPPYIQQAVESLRRNDVGHAEQLLSQALASAGNDAEAHRLMGLVRAMQGRAADAEHCYRQSLACDPKLWQTHHNLGNLLRVQGRFEESATAQRQAIRYKPNYAEAHLGLALALSELGDHEAAEKSCRQALRFQPNFRLAQQILAVELIELERSGEAEQLLRQMLLVGVPERGLAALLEHNLAIALSQQDRLREALILFDQARAGDPNLPNLDFNRANTLMQLGQYGEAKEYYRRALARNPEHVQTIVLLALASALSGDFQGAKRFGEGGIALAPDYPLALIVLAIVDVENNAIAAAKEKLRRVLDDPRLPDDRQTGFALAYAADAFDRHGQFANAFELYSISNLRGRLVNAPRFEGARAMADVERLTTHFAQCNPWRRSPPCAAGSGEPVKHVFLLGFMRCGTTLLEAVLAGNPDVVVSDEMEFLTGPSREFLLDDAGLARLATLGEGEAARWRADYWSAVKKAGLPVGGRVFVDKMPFNSLRLQLIARLFPDAMVLFAIRDPRDVVLSCFRRRFAPTPYSFEFLRLSDCARFYAATMTLVGYYREKLPLTLMEHRYEDMVARFETSVQEVCNFIGIGWNESMRHFDRATWAINSRSASAEQIRKGLYQGAVGQWRNYREQLKPILPILEPWVRKFGYPAE